jgi:hypothetical protein
MKRTLSSSKSTSLKTSSSSSSKKMKTISPKVESVEKSSYNNNISKEDYFHLKDNINDNKEQKLNDVVIFQLLDECNFNVRINHS